jgi:hypothetical protein
MGLNRFTNGKVLSANDYYNLGKEVEEAAEAEVQKATPVEQLEGNEVEDMEAAVSRKTPATAEDLARLPPWVRNKISLRNAGVSQWNPQKKLPRERMDKLRELHAEVFHPPLSKSTHPSLPSLISCRLFLSSHLGCVLGNPQNPEHYNRKMLSEMFEISFEAVGRILRSKWRPPPQRLAEQERKKRERLFVKLRQRPDGEERIKNIEHRLASEKVRRERMARGHLFAPREDALAGRTDATDAWPGDRDGFFGRGQGRLTGRGERHPRAGEAGGVRGSEAIPSFSSPARSAFSSSYYGSETDRSGLRIPSYSSRGEGRESSGSRFRSVVDSNRRGAASGTLSPGNAESRVNDAEFARRLFR